MIERTVPVELREIGTVDPVNTVTVKSLVDGQIAEVHVQEGQFVRKGDVLFIIDQRTFRAALDQAKATLAKDEAQAQYAQTFAQRQAEAVKIHAVTQSDYDLALSNAKAAQATVAAARAAVATAQVQLNYCTIDSPIDGRAGVLLVNQGNVVKANDTSLLMINQMRPIYITFSVPEQHLADVRAALHKGNARIRVDIPGQSGSEFGALTFVNNTVDTATGTVQLRGTFPNQDMRLWPGRFVYATLILREQPHALLVPSTAIQPGQNGSFVYIVNPDETVSQRNVVSGEIYGPDTVVESGLKAGETVVTDGQIRLAPGSKIVIRPSPASAPAALPTQPAG